ncbi:hypothetical protein HUT18_15485 [Streptomyces sp. NA04227]|uniref:hypothetical protein n=1 Tax=Streptomyces sp. NA04227 TaxID=2742136 RepID=UPI0015922A71|nr:hypothetical protein [Streptomyces sp. NA04227]QKW07572.1 hypothetical protein HUT18_15485 [Streptomyces sp. NA04227]
MHLLVVDWDYFFPTPDAGGPPGDHPELYGWPVAGEDEFHTEVIWEKRATGFTEAAAELPGVQGTEGFWDRFTFTDRSVLVFADSNAWAGQLWPSILGGDGAWQSVHLYDAHHDAGYRVNHESFEAWKQSGDGIRCENWMLAHHWGGAELHVRFPPWRQSLEHPTEHPLVPVTMRIDDGTNPGPAFDLVFVCRSGAWVPPWCDADFSAFLEAAPIPRAVHPQNKWVHPRPDPLRMADLKRDLYRRARAVADG